MLDEKDLEIIARLNQESERRMMVMMESYFEPKFQVLSERLDDIEKKLIPQEAMDIMEDRVDDLEKTVAIHTRQIEKSSVMNSSDGACFGCRLTFCPCLQKLLLRIGVLCF